MKALRTLLVTVWRLLCLAVIILIATASISAIVRLILSSVKTTRI